MRLGIKLAVLVGFAALAVLAASAQTPEIASEAAAAMRHFLNVDCEVGEEGEALNRLLAHGDELQPALERLFLDGPEATTLDLTREALGRQWERREKFLESDPDLGLQPEQLLAARTVTRGEYLERGLDGFVRRSRERAVIGLAAIGSERAVELLEAAAPGADEELRSLIRSSLRRFGKGSRDSQKPARQRGGRRGEF